jgi:hypothetical protein
MLTIFLCVMWSVLFAVYFFIKDRNDEVYKFRIMVLNKYGYDWYNTLPSYRRMVWSFKRLTVDNYLPLIKDFTV